VCPLDTHPYHFLLPLLSVLEDLRYLSTEELGSCPVFHEILCTDQRPDLKWPKVKFYLRMRSFLGFQYLARWSLPELGMLNSERRLLEEKRAPGLCVTIDWRRGNPVQILHRVTASREAWME
jgi:hypothetical protein